MSMYTKRHRLWLRAIAMVVVCLFMFNDLAYPLSAYSRFKPFEVNAEGGLKEDAGFLYLGNLIGQALDIEKRMNEEVTPGAVKLLARKHVGKIDFTRFKWQEIYREGKAFCLPYARKDDGREQVLKFFHPDDSAAEFPRRILLQFNDGTKVILEDPLKEPEGGVSPQPNTLLDKELEAQPVHFMERVRKICADLEPTFFYELRKEYKKDKGACFGAAYILSRVLRHILDMPVDVMSQDWIEVEVGEKPGGGILGLDASHAWVTIYKDEKKILLIDAARGQYDPAQFNKICVGKYRESLEEIGIKDPEELRAKGANTIITDTLSEERMRELDVIVERILLLYKLKQIVLETREFWEGFGMCQRHSTEIVRRLLKEGINARIMKHATFAHWFVETDDYVIDGFPEGASKEFVDAAITLGNERFVITEKDSKIAKRLYQGDEDSEMTAEAKNDTEEDIIAFFTRKRNHFSRILREGFARGILRPTTGYAERITSKLAKAEEKLRLAQERRRNERMKEVDGAKSPPPGTAATLLRYMFYKAIFEHNSKTSKEMANKRGGYDSQRNIQRELRILLDVGLVEKSGQRYYLPEWEMGMTPEEIIKENPELNKASLSEKETERVRKRISGLKGEEEAKEEGRVGLKDQVHSRGIHERPAKALADTCGKLYKILPGVKIVFTGDAGGIQVENPETVLDFESLRKRGEKEGGKFVYRGEAEVVVSGDYPDDELRKAAAILAILIKDERFRDGFDPDEPVKGPDGRIYTGDALEAEIDKKLNELEAERALKSVILAKERGAAGLKKELLDDNHSICFYWKKVSEGTVLPEESMLRQGLTEAGVIERELESLSARKTDITGNKGLIELIEDIGKNALRYHFALSYLLEYSGESLTSARSVAANLLRSIKNIEESCRKILGSSGEGEEVSAYEEPEEIQVFTEEPAKEEKEKKINISKELPEARAYLDQLADFIKLFMKQNVKARPVIDDDIDEAEEGEDDDDGLLNLKGPSDRDLKKIEVRPEVDLEIDVLSWRHATEVVTLLRYVTERTEKLTKTDLKLIGEIRKAASKCLRAFKNRKKGALLSKMDLDKYGFRAVNMTWRLEDIVRLCGEIALTGKNPLSDGSPHRIFEILRTEFSGRYASREAIRKSTKNGRGGHLSLSVLKRDLGTLVSLGIVEKKVIEGRALFRAVNMSDTRWRFVEPVLKSLGKSPTKKQKDLAREKVAKARKESSQSASFEPQDPVEADIRYYSQRYGSDNPFMILSVALKKLNWPVIRYLVHHLKDILEKGHKPTMLEEHIFLSAEHGLEQYMEKIRALQDLGSNVTKLPPANGSPARCLGTIFLSETLRQKSDISTKKDLWPKREKEVAGVSLRTVQKEVEILRRLGIIVEGDKPHTYKLRPELQDLPPPVDGKLPAVIIKICEIEHEGTMWLGRYDIPDEIISAVRSKVHFIFASEEEIVSRREKEESKTERVKELFGENVVTDELDLDYEFQQAVERFRREMFLQGNEGGAEVLDWVPQVIMLSALLRCTNQCAHCLESAGPSRKEEMNMEHIARALDTGEIMLNNPVASIVGGEVFLRSDLMEIIGSFPVYSLTTNAAVMTTKEVAEGFIKDLKTNFKARTAAAKKGFTISEEQLRATGGDPYLAAWAQYVLDSSADLYKAQEEEFRICISLDDFHMAQRSSSAAKIANLVEAVAVHYPEARLSFISVWRRWGEAFTEVKEELEKRGFGLEYDPGARDFVLTKGDWKKRIAFGEDVLARAGRAIYLPDEHDGHLNFDEFDIWGFVNEVGLVTGWNNLERVTVNHSGELTLCDPWVAEHGPLFFGNVVEEGWGAVLKRADKDPLFRALLGSPTDALSVKRIVEIAEEYDPGIVESIQKGKPGDITAYLYWLLSNPERKLYVTYRLLNECYKEGILRGQSPLAGMSNDDIKAAVREQIAELRAEFIRRKKIDFIDKYYRTKKGLTKSKSTKGRAFLPSQTDDIVLVAEHFLKNKPETRVLDLGAGNAKALSILSLYARVKGDEVDPELFAEGKTCIDEFSRQGVVDKSRIDLTGRNFLETEKGGFSRYDLIYTYWPFSIRESEEGESLKKRLLEEMHPDAILVVNRVARELHEDLSAEFEEVEFPGEEKDAHPHLRAYRLRRESYATGYEGTGLMREGTEEEAEKFDLKSLLEKQIEEICGNVESVKFNINLPENIDINVHPSAWQGTGKALIIDELSSSLTIIFHEIITNAIEGRKGCLHMGLKDEVSNVKIEAEVKDGSIFMTVEDDGPGISEEGLKKFMAQIEGKTLEGRLRAFSPTKPRIGGFGFMVLIKSVLIFGGDIEIVTKRIEDFGGESGTVVRMNLPLDVVSARSTDEVQDNTGLLEKIKIARKPEKEEAEGLVLAEEIKAEPKDDESGKDKEIVEDFCNAVMARLVETSGKEEKQNVIIGIDTSWLPFDQKNGKLERLLGRVKEKFKVLRQLGGVKVTIITEEGEKLAQEVAKAAGDEKTGTDYGNIAILGSKDTLSSEKFREFMDSSLLVEVEADYFSLEMITLAFKILAGFPDPESHEVTYEEKNPRYYRFKTRPVDPDELLDKYDLQTRLLEKHA